MSIINMQRDMHHVVLGQASLSWPTVASRLNSDGVVYQEFGTVVIDATTDGAASNQRAGLMIQQPRGERTPYRVKGFVHSAATVYLEAGNATTFTGTNDTISNNIMLNANMAVSNLLEFDELFLLDATDANFPVYFAFRTSTTGTYVVAHMSVQRLNVAPPQFASVVS